MTPQTTVKGIAFNDNQFVPKFVIVSDAGRISSSTNLNTWTARTSGTPNDINSVSWGGSFFFAGANGNTLLTSSNGDTWTSAVGPFSSNNSNIVSTYSANGIQFIGSQFGEIATSSGSTTFTSKVSNLNSPINCFCYNNGVYIVAGNSGDISYSTNLDTWTKSLDIGQQRKVFVQPYGSGFIAVIDNTSNTDVTIKTSTNGTSWTDLVLNPPNISTVKSFRYFPVTQAYLILDDTGNTLRSSNGKDWATFNQPIFEFGTTISTVDFNYAQLAGTEYFFLMGTKNVSGTLSPYFITSTFNTTSNQLQSNKNYIVDTSYGLVNASLPSNPNIGDIVRLADGANTWGTANAVINANNKSFLASTGVIDNALILDYSGLNIDLVWTGSYWRIY